MDRKAPDLLDKQFFENEPMKPKGVEAHGLRKVFGEAHGLIKVFGCRKKVVAVENVSFNAFEGKK